MAMIADVVRCLRSNRLVGAAVHGGALSSSERHGRGELVRVVDGSRCWRLRWQIMGPQEWGARGMLTYHLKV